MTRTPIPVVLDVDTGVDDALALMLAVRHPALDVRAVTCVAGNASLEQVVDNTLAVLELSGAGPVPVAAGMSTPLVEPARSAGHVHGGNGLADLARPAHGRRVEPVHAVELLRATLEATSEAVTLIALAPLTNIAVLLRMYPRLAERIAGITMMGGAIFVGNATPSAEFNVWHDPEAAEIVLGCGLPVTMYGLEPFRRVTCDADDIARLRAAGDPLRRTAGDLLAHLDGVTGEDASGGRVVGIGDAGAVCAVIDPEGVTRRRAPVSVSLAPGITRGRTVVDLRTSTDTARPAEEPDGPVEVVTDVDGARYRRLFLEALA
ncbi:nucleoside hydrolase [Tessaracoccus rhinocerotis]|uniref:Nucleoside hydrolase n=1 Tax=Tessaracoccus rhinocerotis TaxID=1689449 RepID=A0A553K0D0_9ACTN|nr:nucleoside hydrolase [Tessaracoccus rhinocerotis]TRY18158.1 nucleoside hydrolase [Tessaracoccus rhinocerotis]